MKLAERKLYVMYRCLLAEWFTSPSVPDVKRRPDAEIKSLAAAGLISWRCGWRLTEAGKAELSIAGIDTRNAKAAQESWNARRAAAPAPAERVR